MSKKIFIPSEPDEVVVNTLAEAGLNENDDVLVPSGLKDIIYEDRQLESPEAIQFTDLVRLSDLEPDDLVELLRDMADRGAEAVTSAAPDSEQMPLSGEDMLRVIQNMRQFTSWSVGELWGIDIRVADYLPSGVVIILDTQEYREQFEQNYPMFPSSHRLLQAQLGDTPRFIIRGNASDISEVLCILGIENIGCSEREYFTMGTPFSEAPLTMGTPFAGAPPMQELLRDVVRCLDDTVTTQAVDYPRIAREALESPTPPDVRENPLVDLKSEHPLEEKEGRPRMAIPQSAPTE